MVSLDGVYERGLLELVASVLILKLVGVEASGPTSNLCPDNIAVRKPALWQCRNRFMVVAQVPIVP
jgi:hypothetical protein